MTTRLGRAKRVAFVGRAFGCVLSLVGMLVINGCIAMVSGTHQDMSFRSQLPDVDVQMEDKTCRVPCTLNVRRQWASHHLDASQNGRIIVQGPVYRRESYGHTCSDAKVWRLMLPAFTDGLLLVPGIVDISMGITEFFPETVMIQEGSYQLEDPCFNAPVQGGLR